MRSRYIVLENGIKTFPHTVCSDDDLYQVYTFFSIGARMKRLLRENYKFLVKAKAVVHGHKGAANIVGVYITPLFNIGCCNF